MLSLPQVEFDIRGTRPANLISGEVVKLDDKELKYIIPDGSPFFAEEESTVVYNAQGGELVLDRDYFFEEEFPPLCKATGRRICCFLRLSQAIVDANAFVTIGYRSVGARFIPRSKLEEWSNLINEGVTPIPWAKVFDVPPTLPAAYHIHNAKTEIGDWFEFTDFFVTWTGLHNTMSSTANQTVNEEGAEAMALLKQTKDQQLDRLNTHDENYSAPHGTTKADIGAGNLDNFLTATPQEDLDGLLANRFSTPKGVLDLAKSVSPDTSELMRQGILPISKFAAEGYIPPSINGSFEGLGSRSECMGICVEVDGRVVVLQNHYDGRSEGLYFSVLSDYKTPYSPTEPYEFDFTAYKYAPPVLNSLGVVPNAIVMGSGNEILMVGKTTVGNPAANDRWFLSLTNNSFDPAGHRFIETDMSNIFTQCGNPDTYGKWNDYFYHGRMSVNLLGNWVVLAVESAPGSAYLGNFGRVSYWKIPKQALVDGTPTAWTVLNLTYRDYDEILYTAIPYWEYAQKTESGGTISQWGRFTFTPMNPPVWTGYMSRRMLNLFAEKPGVPNVVYLNILVWSFLDYAPPGVGLVNAYTVVNMVYELDLVTGVMTTVYKQPVVNVDYTDGGADVFADYLKFDSWYAPLVEYRYPATVMLEDGGVLTSRTGFGQEGSVLNSVVDYRQFKDAVTDEVITSRADLLKGALDNGRVEINTLNTRYRTLQTPVPIGLSSRWLAYESAGENFITFPTVIEDLAEGFSSPKVVCRNVTGGYAVRAEVSNQEVSPVYSRPLVNAVYETNMTHSEGVITITGTASELDSRGVECGTMALSACGWSSQWDGYGTDSLEFPLGSFRAADELGAVITFPKAYTRTLDLPTETMMYEPTAFYGLSSAVKDKIRQLIPLAKRGNYWCFSWFMLNGETGGMFQGFDNAVIYVKYPTLASGNTDSWDAQVFYVTPVVETPNAGHPDCHLITDFTVLGNSVIYQQHKYVNAATQGAGIRPSARGTLSMYRDGNVAKCSLFSGFMCVGGTLYTDLSVFDLNLTTGAISGLGGAFPQWIEGDKLSHIPRVGRTRVTFTNPDTYTATLSNMAEENLSMQTSGGAARILPVETSPGVNDYYAVITGYPDVGWSIFFLQAVELMINGTMYNMPVGTVDLRDIDSDPSNKTFYVYATIEDQEGRYIISINKLRQNNSLLHVATVVTGESQILQIVRLTPFLIGDYEVSYDRKGGVIPVSVGFPQDEGDFLFLHSGELLP